MADDRFGLAGVLPDMWEATPWYLRIFGMPAFRLWHRAADQGYWEYATELPPTPTYGGIDRTSSQIWRDRYITPTPIERYMNRGASLSEAVHLAAKDKRNG